MLQHKTKFSTGNGSFLVIIHNLSSLYIFVMSRFAVKEVTLSVGKKVFRYIHLWNKEFSFQMVALELNFVLCTQSLLSGTDGLLFF